MNVPAIEGGQSSCEGISWPEWPIHDEAEKSAVVSVLESGAWWHGEQVALFEKKFAEFQGAGHAVSCTNGTAALRMGLFACGVGPGDEVIVPPYTFVATALAPMLLGAKPVFADIELETTNLSAEAVSRVITEKTRAIVPVHFAGLPCDMNALQSVANDHGLRIVEDACHSWGTRVNGVGAGAIGDCGAFSFQMSKNITAGEGGILVTNDSALADLARSYANCGRTEGAPWYEHSIIADNLRMTEIQAAILLSQLQRLDDHVERRIRSAGILDDTLSAIPGLDAPATPENVDRRSYHMYLFRFIESHWSIDRARFVEALQQEGVPCSTGYPMPLTEQPLFADRQATVETAGDACPQAERLCRDAVWIPHQVLLANVAEVKRVGAAISGIFEYYGR